MQSTLAIISTLLALIAAVMTALWAYTIFILERGLIPPTEQSIESNFVGFQSGKAIVEIQLHLKNKGSATLITKNIRVDVRYLKDEEPIESFDYKDKKKFGRVNFRHSLRNEFFNLGDDTDKDRIQKMGDQRGFKIIQHDTFVLAGIDQVYSFTIALPDDSTYYLVYSSFEYAQRPSVYQLGIIKLSRKLGLIQYSLNHISKAHSIERVFSIPQ